MSILLVEASLHLSLAPFFPLTIHPSHHSSLSPSPLSPFTPFIDLLVACFGKKSLTIHLSHHSNYRSGYTKTHWKSTRAILRPVRWRSFLPTKGTSALSLPLLLSLPHSFCSRPTPLPDLPPAKMPSTGTLCSPFNCFRSCLGISWTLTIQRFGTSQSLLKSLPVLVIYGIVTAGERASLREKRESIDFPLSQSRSFLTLVYFLQHLT